MRRIPPSGASWRTAAEILVLEAVYSGVPMLAFPLMGDQFPNCNLIVNDISVIMKIIIIESLLIIMNVINYEIVANIFSSIEYNFFPANNFDYRNSSYCSYLLI